MSSEGLRPLADAVASFVRAPDEDAEDRAVTTVATALGDCLRARAALAEKEGGK